MSDLSIDFKDIVEKSRDAIFITKSFPLQEPGPEIVYANDAYCRQNGYAIESAIGQNAKILQFLESDENSLLDMRELLNSEQGTQVIYRKLDDDGRENWIELSIHPVNDNFGDITHFVVIQRDISEQKQLEQMLQEMPRKDSLTGLLNKNAFDEFMQREFSLHTRTQNGYAVLLVDIDRFSVVNETHGRSTGDETLKLLASMFEDIFRTYDQVARLGKDQFCVLLRHTSLEHALVSAIRFRQAIQNRVFSIQEYTVKITVSIGVSQVLAQDISHSVAMERAHKALQLAKNNGRDQVQIYKEETLV